MKIWQGYVLIDNGAVIPQTKKDLIRNKAIGTEQHNSLNFRDSLNKEKSYVLLCLPMQGDELDDFFNTLSLSSFKIFGKKVYPNEDLKEEFKLSCKDALVDMNAIIAEFQPASPF